MHSFFNSTGVGGVKTLRKLPPVDLYHRRVWGYMPPLTGSAKGDRLFNNDDAPDHVCLAETVIVGGLFVVLNILQMEPSQEGLNEMFIATPNGSIRQDMVSIDRRHERAFDFVSQWSPYAVHTRSTRARPDDLPIVHATRATVKLMKQPRVLDAVRIAAAAGPLPKPTTNEGIIWV